MYRHLVAVEVRVECLTGQRVKLDCLAVNQHRHEGLNAQPVQGRRAVEQHRVALNDLLQRIPDHRFEPVNHALCGLDVRGMGPLDQLVHHERLEQLQRHFPREAALVQLQLRAHHDDRAARVVHTLAQKVLAEPTLLALEHVAQGLELTPVAARHRSAASRVVNQRVHCLLQQSALVVDDRLGRIDLDDAAQAVIAVDHASVEIVEVGRGEPPAVELDHRAQLGRQHRQHRQHHPLGHVLGSAESLDDLEALDGTHSPSPAALLDFLAQLEGHLVQVELFEQLVDGFRAETGDEQLAEIRAQVPLTYRDQFDEVPVAELRDELLGRQVKERLDRGIYVGDTLGDGGLFLLDPLAELILGHGHRQRHRGREVVALRLLRVGFGLLGGLPRCCQ